MGGAYYEPGENQNISTQEIPPTGGVIEGPPGTPLEGISVNFPAGAVSATSCYSLALNNGTLHVASGQPSGIVIDLSPCDGVLNRSDGSESTKFDQPVEITVPYDPDNGEGFVIPYFIDADGKLDLLETTNIDSNNHTITFVTFHCSWYSWIIPTASAPGPEDSYDTGYRPGNDGFKIINPYNEATDGQSCVGMSAFSLWYFSNEKNQAAGGNFYSRFMDEIPPSNKTGQNIIATSAQTLLGKVYETFFKPNTINTSDEWNFQIITNALKNSGKPVMIYLEPFVTHVTHVVLCYRYTDDGTGLYKLFIYDPNHPGNESLEITYDSHNKDFSTYNFFYSKIRYLGIASFTPRLNVDFQILYDCAKANFNCDTATINIASHTNGQSVSEKNIELRGTIISGSIPVTKIEVWNDTSLFQANVYADGSLFLPISLHAGENHLIFSCSGTIVKDGQTQLITIGSNMDLVDFVINSTYEYSAILVTLTWETDQTDLDLYVIDPTGDYSCYYHMPTLDGGELDRDDVDGFGPEHWTLTYNDNVRWGQDYKVRVHYFRNEGIVSNFTVTIVTNEGTVNERVNSYRGNLAVSDVENDAPSDVGADWRDIATINISQ